ncbi:hypothetical protein [Kitasatospora sp. NPDC018619]
MQLALGLSESPVQREPRVHPDLSAADAAEQLAEVEGNRFSVIDADRS